jgi:hypothetical protein
MTMAGLEVLHRVEERLALGDARGLRAHVDDVGPEALAGHLERGARPRRRLEEEVHDGAPVEDARVLHLVARHREPPLRGVEDVEDVALRELRDAEVVTVAPHVRRAGRM